MKPFFSIIIPTLNEGSFLPKLLTDLKKQISKDFEVIIVDGHSEDDTEKIAKSYKKDLRLNVINVSKRNVSYQRNYGAKIAKSNFLVFLDADSRISRVFFRRLKKIILKERGLVFLPTLVPDEKTAQAQVIFNLTNRLIEISQVLGKPLASGGSIIIEKNFYHLVKGFDESLFIAEDHNLLKKINQWGVRAKILRTLKVTFNLRRMRNEGKMKVFYKYALAVSHFFLKGDVKKNLFDYQMGGHLYPSYRKTKSQSKIGLDSDQNVEHLIYQ